MTACRYLLAVALVLAPAAFASTPGAPGASGVFDIIQYLDVSDSGTHVVVAAGKKDGILEGTVFKTFRPAQPPAAGNSYDPVWVNTGKLKAEEVQDTYTVASVVGDATNSSKAFFPKFPGVMAGDKAVEQRVNLARNQIVTPTVTVGYFDLFADPKSQPLTFEMTESGMTKLKEAGRVFLKARLSLLVVEGYTDDNGPSAANQVESYQRALTVRQYLIDALGFDESRVVAFGFGESELVDSSRAPGYIQANRRIVLKAIPVNNHASN